MTTAATTMMAATIGPSLLCGLGPEPEPTGPAATARLAPLSPSSAKTRSRALWNRASGLFTRQCFTTRSSAGGVSG